MNAEQVGRAAESLRLLLSEIGWGPEQTQTGVFHIDFGSPHLPLSTGLAAIIPETAQFVLYLNFGFFVTREKRDEVLRFISRANWDLIIGNFEMDYIDGHLRFKSSLDFEGVELSERLIRNAVLGSMRAVDAYADVLMKMSREGTDS